MRTIILLMDSFGIGYAHDAAKYGDEGADTLGHICEWFAANRKDAEGKAKPLYLPNLAARGLAKAAELSRGCALPASLGAEHRLGAYTYAQEVSRGKDTLSGHWEIAGVPVDFDWGYFPNQPHCFPDELVQKLIKEGGLPGVLGECHASGTEIIKELGEEQVATGKPIIYTSADSVLQIAAHEEAFGLERLYDLCKLAYKLVQPYNIARVIARPFVGTCAADFSRTTNRHDYAVPAPKATLLDKMVAAGGSVYAVGKIADIFAHRGITKHYAAGGLEKLVDATIEAVKDAPDKSIVFTNFVDFDSSFGHRRDIQGYGEALEYFDSRLPEITSLLKEDDLLLITADHGNDPSWTGTDHTREKIPVLFSGADVKKAQLEPMATFADIGCTIADYMGIEPTFTGMKAKSLHR
ncbi:MAG: phosphopentomutase [Phascolarctobacterium sp.]